MKPIIELMKDSTGAKISKVKVMGGIIALFLIIFVPIGIFIHYAQINHEKAKEENSRLLTSGDTPASQVSDSAAKDLKDKSNAAVDNLGGNKNTNPMLGANPLNDNSASTSSSLNHQSGASTLNSANGQYTQEQRPPMGVANGVNQNVPSISDIDREISTQKVDKVKRRYDGLNAPISLGSHVDASGAKSAIGQQSTQSGSSTAASTTPQSSGIGLGGGFSNVTPDSGASGNQSPEDQNKQSEKRAFLANAGGGDADSMVNPRRVEDQISKYSLSAGDFIPAVMISALNSDTPGQVIAQTKEDEYDTVHGKFLLIPKASRLIGIYDSNVAYMQKRIPVAWKRVDFPDGRRFMLQGVPGTDLSGAAGLYNAEGVDNHYWQIYGSSAIIGLITGAMQMSQNNTNPNVQAGGLGVTTEPSAGQTISGSLGQQMGQTGMAIANKNIQVQPTLTIPSGYEFNLMLTADLILLPLPNKYK